MAIDSVNEEFRRLPACAVDAEKLDIIFPCDGAASVGQVGNHVAIDLTNAGGNARMCCTTAVGAGSEQHVGIGKRARRDGRMRVEQQFEFFLPVVYEGGCDVC